MRFCWFILFYCLHCPCAASEYLAQVKQAQIRLNDDHYEVWADLAYQLSPDVKEALENGVPLQWKIKMELRQKRAYWKDKTLAKQSLHYRLQYHALLNLYRLENVMNGNINNFSTLNAALDAMSRVRHLFLVSSKKLAPHHDYMLAMRIYFENHALPLPLQTKMLANRQWQLSSHWSYWNF